MYGSAYELSFNGSPILQERIPVAFGVQDVLNDLLQFGVGPGLEAYLSDAQAPHDSNVFGRVGRSSISSEHVGAVSGRPVDNYCVAKWEEVTIGISSCATTIHAALFFDKAWRGPDDYPEFFVFLRQILLAAGMDSADSERGPEAEVP